jgi:glycosyltransferase involved in cell wall biosynthesis
MPPTFSVVIPTYNHADYLRQSLKSVIDQTLSDFEVIVVNNYSEDDTLEVIKEVGDQRVKVVNFRNQGIIGAARNAGIKVSEGTYVAFLDSDDSWYPDKLERVSEAIKSDPQAGLFCHNQDWFREDESAIQSHFGPPPEYPGDMFEHLMLEFNGPSTSATVVSRKYLDEVGLFNEDPGYITVEDYDLWLKLSQVCSFNFMDEVLGSVQFHPESAADNIELHFRNGLTLIDKHSEELRSPGRACSDNAIRRLYARSFYTAARKYQRKGAYSKPLGYYLRTIKAYPLYTKAYAGLALLAADRLIGHGVRKRLAGSLLGPSWRWG